MVLLGNYAFFLQNVRQEFESADEMYLRALAADPEDAINHANYAGLCIVSERREMAGKHLAKAWSLTENKADA